MQDAKEEVRARLNIEDVISEYVPLKRAGRNFKGLSPFSSEKTPSFVVSPDKHIWHDFSSGKGGDVFSFIMEVEGVEFREALEQLARRAGVDLTQYDNKQSGEIAKKKKKLLEITEWATKYYQQSLVKNQHALEYVFKKRGLSKDIVMQFRIGYAPDGGDALVRFLAAKGYTKKDLADAGLTNRFGGDIFRGRVTIPLMDASGQVIGFTGRILKDDPKAPKYLNTPQTLLYDKSRHVFGLSQAKEAIRKNDSSVIVEGNMDVISSHQAGVTNVVATAGTAMTEWHLKALVRLSQNVKLAFDADKAGLAATERAIPIAQIVGVELTIVTLPGDAKDPDELIQQDVKLWQQAIDHTHPVVDWVMEQYKAREDMAMAAGKRRFTAAALGVVRLLQDVVEREHYIRKIADMTDTSPGTIARRLTETDNTGQPGAPTRQVKASTHPAERSVETMYENAVLTILVAFPETRGVLRGVDLALFTAAPARQLATYLVQNPAWDVTTIPPELKDIEDYVNMLLEIAIPEAKPKYDNWSSTDIEKEAANLLRQIKLKHKKHELDDLIKELSAIEFSGDDERVATLYEKRDQLMKEIHNG